MAKQGGTAMCSAYARTFVLVGGGAIFMPSGTPMKNLSSPNSLIIYHRRQIMMQQTTKPEDAANKQPVEGKGIRHPRFPFAEFEKKWQHQWEAEQAYKIDLQTAQKPYYNLMMFPYPSAEGLHIGNFYSYVGSDVHGRWMAMQGYDVFEPMGFDAFGMNSENFAIKKDIHPRVLTARNIERFRTQLKGMGNRFDWSHDLSTTEPEYYRWTQWIFVQLFKAGLAERRQAPVNWCPKDKTVLADEQVINGRCERCETLVERRWLSQWFLKLTNYAQKLLDGLEHLDWSERVKRLQHNWIGRSEGLEFSMEIEGWPEERVQVYTTRPDTIYGMTFIALAPQHAMLERITTPEQRAAVTAYQATAQQSRSYEERTVTGVFIGAWARHPLTGERIPIWVADYVLDEHGSGAIMGVPAHDEIDLRFAHTSELPVHSVVKPGQGEPSADEAFTQDGVLYDSGEFSGMTSQQARDAISSWFEQHNLGQRVAKYRVRDWLISRQRYWGPPIPIIYCPEHGAQAVPEEQLPVLLPDIKAWKPTGTGVSPLAAIESFVNTTCPVCGGPARRETDVNDNFLDSAWYYLRYPSTHDADQPWDTEITRKWLPVDMCIGGGDHSVLHLMYVRFIAMALHDLGHLHFQEPFTRMRANGMITMSGGKMAKSKGNVVNPDDYVEQYGADITRLYLMFMGPYEDGGDFSDSGIGGAQRFLERVWQMVERVGGHTPETAQSQHARRTMHRTIQRVTEDIGTFKYHTAIAALMEYLNSLKPETVSREELRTLLLLLAPISPFITEELWSRVGGQGSIHRASWPGFDEEQTRAEELTIIVQINGRIRDSFVVAQETPEEEIKQRAIASPRIYSVIGDQQVQRVIYVPGRLVNIVV
jgi:leucyl-tRNA synthetase